MKEKLKNLPPPLRKQALLRFAGAGACFCLLLVVIIGFRQMMLCLPFFIMGAFSAGSGALIVWRTNQGKILILEGVCSQVDTTLFRHRPKAVVVKCGEHSVKVYLRHRTGNLSPGDSLRIYVADSTPVYEDDGLLILGGCMEMEKT